MEKTPIKKFEKIMSEQNHQETMTVTKVTDFQNNQVVYTVSDSHQEFHFNTLKDARDHVRNLASSPDKKIQSSLSIA
jgi:glycine betaine/choline ABC-type transport system substrate-binding protein